jgi:hypothetical protein
MKKKILINVNNRIQRPRRRGNRGVIFKQVTSERSEYKEKVLVVGRCEVYHMQQHTQGWHESIGIIQCETNLLIPSVGEKSNIWKNFLIKSYNLHVEKFFIFDGLLEVFLLNWQMLFISITNIPFWKELKDEFFEKETV